MALRGNLKDFSLPDVFQLVTLSGKTGILRIRRADGAEGSVWFRGGDVFFAQSNWHREPLGERLVAASKITPSALARALEAQRSEGASGRRLGQILVDEGYITDKVLEAFVQEQIQDTIFDLFRWDEGDFDFDPLEGVPDEDIGLSVSIENIVMEGSRRLEEWNRIKKKIPSMEIVFKMATAPGEGTFEISLKPVEWNLLLLVDGTRAVADLATDTSRTDFEVSRVLYGLFSAGLLEVASDEEVERLRADRARQEARAAESAARTAEAEPTRVPAELPTSAEPTGAGPAEPRAAPEVPTFLSGKVHDATVEDMAVFEQMMGAVLQAPEAPDEETGPTEAAAGPAAVDEARATPSPPAAIDVPPAPPAAEAPVPEAPIVAETAPAIEVSASDFFTAEEGRVDGAEESIPFPPQEGAPREASTVTADTGLDIPVSEEVVVIIPEPLEEPEVAAAEEAAEPDEVVGDLSELLSALQEEEPGLAPSAGSATEADAVDDAGPTGVISTDAFMSDFDGIGGDTFSGGLGDELTALTGGGRARPSGPAPAAPAAPPATIHRDQMVDKDLVMRVIEGIKSL